VVTVRIRVDGPRRTRYAEQVSLRLNARTDVRRFEILAREPMPWPHEAIGDPGGGRGGDG
jgi:hypothetical protein